MSYEPVIKKAGFNYLADYQARKARKEALSNKVEEFRQRAGDYDFDETEHPRGLDGRFTKNAADSPVISRSGGLLPTLDEVEDPLTERDIKETKPKTPCGKVDGISTCGSVFSLVLKNGQKLSIYDDDVNQLPVEVKKQMLRQLADLHDMYPKKKFKTTKILLKNLLGVQNAFGPGHDGIGGWVATKTLPAVGSQSRININAANDAFHDSFRMEKGHHMPQGEDKPYGRYLIAHEFGHQFDIDKNRRGPAHYQYDYKATKALFNNPDVRSSLSGYGKSDPMEAYAEAFAEWHLSRGRTKNVAALAYAKHEKWNPFSSLRSSGFMDPTVEFADNPSIEEPEDSAASLQPGEYIIVENEVKGPYIIGERPEIPDPTPEEQKRADDLVKEVLKELGQ